LEWRPFIQALGSRSAVCSLIHPSKKLCDLLVSFVTEDVNILSLNTETLSYLQKQFPILFDLLLNLKSHSFEHHTLKKMLSPILLEMVKRANAPFTSIPSRPDNHPEEGFEEDDVSFLPHLPCLRKRGVYVADKNPGNKICTKKRLGHPTLLPGVFTIFCEHGKFNN